MYIAYVMYCAVSSPVVTTVLPPIKPITSTGSEQGYIAVTTEQESQECSEGLSM